ncbi:MAG TPA: hypothetical protein VIT21_07225 [Chthoniobacterales bacterium]
MNTPAEISTDEPGPGSALTRSPDLEGQQFEELVRTYMSLGLNRAKASAAAQADCLNSNIVAFRRRDTIEGEWFLFKAA